MTSPDKTSSKPAKTRSVNPALLVKAVIYAAAALLVLLIVSRLFSWKPFSWISSAFSTIITTEEKTLDTLLALTEVKDVEELLASEYFGEVIVSTSELRDRVTTEVKLWIDKKKKCRENEKLELSGIARDSVAYWYLTTYFDKDPIAALARIEAKDPTCLLPELGRGADFVYLSRGNVKVWYKLNEVLKDATCLDLEEHEVKPCDLSKTAKIMLKYDKARQIRVTVNPYFSFHKATKNEPYTHGWEVIKGEGSIPNPDILPGLRELAHEELRTTALEHDIFAQADASLNLTIERMIKLFLDKTVEIVSAKNDTSGASDQIMIGTCIAGTVLNPPPEPAKTKNISP